MRDLFVGDAEIGGDHLGVVAHRVGRAVGDLDAVVEHDDVVGNLHHHRHVVLDQQDRDVVFVADGEQELVELGALARIEAGGRLVEAEQHRIGAHGAGDLEPALRAVGQLAGRIVGALDQADAVEPVARLVDRGALGRRVGREAEHAEQREAGGEHQRVVLGDQQILQHGHAGKQADVLEGAGDARLLRHQIVGHALEQKERAVGSHHAALAAVGQAVERVPHRGVAVVQRDAALGRLVEAGDAVEHGGLAGAVRSDQRGDVAARGVEGEIVDGDQAAEAHGQMLDAEHGRAVARGSISRVPP